MKVQRPIVIFQGAPMRYDSLRITRARNYIEVNGKTITMGPADEPAIIPEFAIMPRGEEMGWAGCFFFQEYTRKSGRKVFVF